MSIMETLQQQRARALIVLTENGVGLPELRKLVEAESAMWGRETLIAKTAGQLKVAVELSAPDATKLAAAKNTLHELTKLEAFESGQSAGPNGTRRAAHQRRAR